MRRQAGTGSPRAAGVRAPTFPGLATQTSELGATVVSNEIDHRRHHHHHHQHSALVVNLKHTQGIEQIAATSEMRHQHRQLGQLVAARPAPPSSAHYCREQTTSHFKPLDSSRRQMWPTVVGDRRRRRRNGRRLATDSCRPHRTPHSAMKPISAFNLNNTNHNKLLSPTNICGPFCIYTPSVPLLLLFLLASSLIVTLTQSTTTQAVAVGEVDRRRVIDAADQTQTDSQLNTQTLDVAKHDQFQRDNDIVQHHRRSHNRKQFNSKLRSQILNNNPNPNPSHGYERVDGEHDYVKTAGRSSRLVEQHRPTPSTKRSPSNRRVQKHIISHPGGDLGERRHDRPPLSSRVATTTKAGGQQEHSPARRRSRPTISKHDTTRNQAHASSRPVVHHLFGPLFHHSLRSRKSKAVDDVDDIDGDDDDGGDDSSLSSLFNDGDDDDDPFDVDEDAEDEDEADEDDEDDEEGEDDEGAYDWLTGASHARPEMYHNHEQLANEIRDLERPKQEHHWRKSSFSSKARRRHGHEQQQHQQPHHQSHHHHHHQLDGDHPGQLHSREPSALMSASESSAVPYQKPVVVSISDNSFVSASPALASSQQAAPNNEQHVEEEEAEVAVGAEEGRTASSLVVKSSFGLNNNLLSSTARQHRLAKESVAVGNHNEHGRDPLTTSTTATTTSANVSPHLHRFAPASDSFSASMDSGSLGLDREHHKHVVGAAAAADDDDDDDDIDDHEHDDEFSRPAHGPVVFSKSSSDRYKYNIVSDLDPPKETKQTTTTTTTTTNIIANLESDAHQNEAELIRRQAILELGRQPSNQPATTTTATTTTTMHLSSHDNEQPPRVVSVDDNSEPRYLESAGGGEDDADADADIEVDEDENDADADDVDLGADLEVGLAEERRDHEGHHIGDLYHKSVGSPESAQGAPYAELIVNPLNTLPHQAGQWRQWHSASQPHLASIRMVQEDPADYQQQGGLNSAIIAILFGIGATGVLVMIVGAKMRRIATKARRRHLLPGCNELLINTLPN